MASRKLKPPSPYVCNGCGWLPGQATTKPCPIVNPPPGYFKSRGIVIQPLPVLAPARPMWNRRAQNPGMDMHVVELIGRYRRQMLGHSALYYGLNESVIDDHTWQQRADLLVWLQQTYGWEVNFYDRAFRDFDGSTGYHLPYQDRGPMNMAHRMLNLRREAEIEAFNKQQAAKAPPRKKPLTKQRSILD